MKIFLLFIISFLIQLLQYDSIEYSKLRINDISLGDSILVLINKIGEPDSSKIEMNEFLDTPFKVLFYDSSKFYLEDNIFDGFYIKNSRFNISGLNISAGDSLSKLENMFPQSYKKFRSKNDKYLRIQIGQTDSFLLFEIQNGKISSYLIWGNY